MAQHVEPLLRGLKGDHVDFLSFNVSPAPFPEGVVGFLEAWEHDDCLVAMTALVRWADQFLYLLQNPIRDAVLKSKLLKMGYKEPTEWDRYLLGVPHTTYSLEVYHHEETRRGASKYRTNVTQPGWFRGFGVKPVAKPTVGISDDQKDHDPFPQTCYNKKGARPVAPIECVPSPQSAFGLKWDCCPEDLAERLKILTRNLNFDKMEAWASEKLGFDRQTTAFDRAQSKASMRLLWRYLSEAPTAESVPAAAGP